MNLVEKILKERISNSAQITIRLNNDILSEIEAFCATHKITRNVAIRRIVEEGWGRVREELTSED